LQITDGKLQIHINGHECIRDIEVSSKEVLSLTLPVGACLSKVVFVDQVHNSAGVKQLLDEMNKELDELKFDVLQTQQILIVPDEKSEYKGEITQLKE
jgi:hypothetical protein